MTDKKIIIDGVDVAGCVFLDDYSKSMCNGFRSDNSGFHQGHCIQNRNCYYKQFQRKTQECEELKEDKRLALQLINGILNEFNLTNYDWAEDQNEIHTKLVDMFDSYKQVLNKIEELSKEQQQWNNINQDGCDTGFELDALICNNSALYKIFNIINEVKQ